MRHRVTGTFDGKPAEVLWFDGVMHGPDKLLDRIGENASQEIFYGPVPVQIVAPLLTLEEDAGILIEAAFDTVEFSTFDARIHESEVEVEEPVEKHYGPGPHPSGSEQTIHRQKTDRFGMKTSRTVRRETIAQSKRIFDGTTFRPADEVLDGPDYNSWENSAMERWQIKRWWVNIRHLLTGEGGPAPGTSQSEWENHDRALTEDMVKQLDSAVSKWTTTEDIVLWRGRGYPGEFPLAPGDTWYNPVYIAATSSQRDARAIAADRAEAFSDKFKDEMVMEIHIPKGYHLGAPHLDPGETSVFEEYILPRDSKFKVRSVETRPWHGDAGDPIFPYEETYEYVVVDLIDQFQVRKHYGPDDHPSGTPQSVHGPGLQDPRHFTDDPAGGPRGRTMVGTKQILESWLKEKSFTYEDRITFTMEEADEAYLKDPKKFLANSKWYVTEAQAGAKRIAKEHNFSLEDASFFIAVSSPNHQWEINERVAGQIAKLFRDNEDTIKAMADDGVDPKKIWAAVKSQWNGQYGFSGYNNDYGPKAVRVFLGESIDSVLSGTKVRSFWNNIMFPNQKTAVTIDGWMANVIGGDPFGELKGAKSILTPKIPGGSSIGWKAIGGTYNFFGSVLEQSTERFNEKHGTSLLPHEFQASLWMYWKNEKFTPEEKSRRTKAKNK